MLMKNRSCEKKGRIFLYKGGEVLMDSIPNSSRIREYIEFEFLGDPPHLLWDLGHSFLLLIDH